ncbi:polysaccharide lyase [Botryobacter ruber]|uniref:polysaccharide lyase n=1 Tax=Botryobacter ruber TaxID=2171629 RepID=UPI000E0BC58E|nr:polysaccharide lyase [Botryobacter ruber]
MNFHTFKLLTPFLLGLAVVSCEQNELEEIAPSVAEINSESTNLATSTKLLFEETAEGKYIFPLSGSKINRVHLLENCDHNWTLSKATNPSYQGKRAIRFEIRKEQPLVGSGAKIRSEVTIIKGTEDTRFTKDIWYSFAVYFPSVGFEYDDTRDCLNQWYENGKNETTIRAEKDKVYLEVTPAAGADLKVYDLLSSNSGIGSGASVLSTFTSIPKNQWHEFTFHFIHSEGADGLIEVFRNGVKIHHITGRNIHLEYPKWKLGLYKTSFLDGSSPHSSRVVYFDNIRVGKAGATLADMVSKATTDSNTGSNYIESFTLVDASTEKDIMTLRDGAKIDLSKLGVKKLNIRANTRFPAVVKFKLSGEERETYIDDIAPYALFGDNKKGNYYYGDWNPPSTGSYTLKATPHVGTKKKLGATTGPSYSINFTIKK